MRFLFCLLLIGGFALGHDVLKDENILDLDEQISEPLREQSKDDVPELPNEPEPRVTLESEQYPCDPSRSECIRPNRHLHDSKTGKNPLKPLPQVHKN